MATYTVRTRSGEYIGPLTVEELKAIAVGGRLHSADEVRRDGTPDWHPAKEVADLFSAPSPRGNGRPSTRSDPSASRKLPARSRRPVVVLAGLLIGLIVAATLAWFLYAQIQLGKRHRANDELRAMIEDIEQLPPATDAGVVIDRIGAVQAAAAVHQPMIDQSNLDRVDSLRSRLEAAKASVRLDGLRQAFRKDVDSLRARIRGAGLSATLTVPAWGLFAVDPEEARRTLTDLAEGVDAMGDDFTGLYQELKGLNEATPARVEQCNKRVHAMIALLVIGDKFTHYSLRTLNDELQRIGLPESERDLDAEGIRKEFKRQGDAFLNEWSALRQRAESSGAFSEAQCQAELRPVQDAIIDWANRCAQHPAFAQAIATDVAEFTSRMPGN